MLRLASHHRVRCSPNEIACWNASTPAPEINTITRVSPWSAPERQPQRESLDDLVLYLVDTADGPVGVLSDVEHSPYRETTLHVRQGWFGRRSIHVPAASILGIDHRARRIILARGAAPLERSLWLRFFG
jgi:hypothetical protein